MSEVKRLVWLTDGEVWFGSQGEYWAYVRKGEYAYGPFYKVMYGRMNLPPSFDPCVVYNTNWIAGEHCVLFEEAIAWAEKKLGEANKQVKPEMSVREFCDLHKACQPGRDWALENCKSMSECWEKLPIDYLVWVAAQKGVLTVKELRLFTVFCCRQVLHLLHDYQSQGAFEVVERFANGKATVNELKVAHASADRVAMLKEQKIEPGRNGTSEAAWAVSYASLDLTPDSVRHTARLARHALREWASGESRVDALEALDKASAQQAAWLRENTKPNFKKEVQQ